MVTDYQERKKGESSVSRYVQANVTTAKGKNANFSDTKKDTPDSFVIDNLKTATCTTYDIEQPSEPESADMTLKETRDPINEPEPTGHLGKYGYVQVTETSGGHVFIIDNTPGNRRVFTLHPTGTYTSTVDNGDMIDKTANNKYTIVTENWYINVVGDHVEVIQNDCKVNIKSNYKLTIEGDKSENIDGDSVTRVKSDMAVTVEGNVQINVNGTANINVDGDATAIVGGLTKLISNKVEIDGNDGNGPVTGVVTGECICAFTGLPHGDISQTVKASR